MILDELVLHNVGTFAGRHVITLTPPSAKKPIVLVGGLNGAGKTTILDAIHLVLYGSLAQVSGRRSGSYESYLGSLIHHGVPDREGAAIELTFHARWQGAEHYYRLRRWWRSTGAAVRESLTVSVDGRHDEALTSTWSDQVETFLPRGISGLFFFDGEQIEAMADMHKSREVLGSALAALLGLDLVDRLGTDLSVLRRRHRSQQVPDELLREVVEERQRVVTSLRKAEESASSAIATQRVDLERADKHLFEVKERYRSAGGDLADRRDAAEAAVMIHREALARTEDELREELAGVAPLLQVATALGGVAGRAVREAEAQRHQVVTEVITSRDEAVIRKLRESRIRSATLTAIEAYLTADREQRRDAASVVMVTGLQDSIAIDFLMKSGLPMAARRLRGLLERLTQAREELDQAERVMVAMPDPEMLGSLRQELDAATAEVAYSQAALTQAEERRTALRQERSRADAAHEAALDKAARADLAAGDGRRLVEHVDRVRVTLERLRTAAAERHLERISQLVLESLRHLLRKEQLVTGIKIDAETHAVELTGLNGRPLSPKELSAGERQLLAVALLWGLARAAGKPLPVVIDTPLGRLDGSHREHLLDRYFPSASHQVILLSTDTEIDELAYDRLARHVGRTYRLEFDPLTNATAVEPGYFWE
jgi:DNA sulfur modification protein DndD